MLMKKIFDERALLFDDIMVIADLHLGIESELRWKGIGIPPQTDIMKERVLALVGEFEPSEVVLLGDVKHNYPVPSYQENIHVPGFINEIAEKTRVTIVKGNHDGGIENFGCNAQIANHYEFGDRILMSHGHLKLDDLKYNELVLAHNHPAIQLNDDLGKGMTEPVWISTRLNGQGLKAFGLKKSPEITIIPAFNELLTGIRFNSRENKTLLGPLFRNNLVDIDNSRVNLLDGTSLGRLKDLR